MFYLYPRLALLLLLFAISSLAAAQPKYQLSPGPDLWYNSVDGFRLGLRLKGQVAGTFGDGPHRLDMGVWLGSKLPKDPVSYYVSLTEPIAAWSDFGSEAAVEGFSSIREGMHWHGLTVRKRWQQGFNDREFVSGGLTAGYRQRYDDRYPAFPQLWQGRPVYEATATGLFRREFEGLGPYSLSARASVGRVETATSRIYAQLELEQQAVTPLGNLFSFRHRLFLGVSGDDAPVESRYRLGGGRAVDWMNSGITRSRGTIPQPWMRDGWVAVAGGPNLRGYHRGEALRMAEGASVTHASVAGANFELDLPNPVSWLLDKVPVVGGLLQSKLGVFHDVGAPLAGSDTALRADAGMGLALGLNLPEYLGRSGMFTFRYDVPLWLSHPGVGEPPWKYRSVLGVWSIISL